MSPMINQWSFTETDKKILLLLLHETTVCLVHWRQSALKRRLRNNCYIRELDKKYSNASDTVYIVNCSLKKLHATSLNHIFVLKNVGKKLRLLTSGDHVLVVQDLIYCYQYRKMKRRQICCSITLRLLRHVWQNLQKIGTSEYFKIPLGHLDAT